MYPNIIGLDIGALTLKGVLLDAQGSIERHAYRFHQGNPLTTLQDLLSELCDGHEADLAITGSGAHLLPEHPDIRRIDAVQAAIAAVGMQQPQARNILDVGGASLTLIRLDSGGKFRGFAANSQCAAGTGSFLDEQATRLGLTYDQMAAMAPVADPPAVATRCAVFAKSDLIHLQQEGATAEQMWAGLCRGMAQTALQTLLKGKPLGALTAVVGGVAQNSVVLRWLGELADAQIVTFAEAHLSGALGAARLLWQQEERHATDWRRWLSDEAARPGTTPLISLVEHEKPCCPAECGTEEPQSAGERSYEPLALNRTRYPSFEVEESYVDQRGNEVRVSRWAAGQEIEGTLGIDIGSTSTKLCVIGAEGEVLVDIYRKTSGDPIGATKKLFDALRQLAGRHESHLRILGCGTTGSGRKLVGAVVGADAMINEISAHVAGAMYVDPEIETIFEIGGQDSKYMRTKNGAITDANMNYVCAAGTGSFVEEQARKLGVPLEEVGDRVLGLVPPPSSDRCTVFMEQDVNKLLRSGYDASQALAAVMRSVVHNYLNKVVGNRPYSRTKIGFQGATARNKGLVAAFETLLGVEMVVSPYCHVMGAWGVALLTQAQLRERRESTRFLGLDLSERRIELRKERCELCNNSCEITFASVEGSQHSPSWGYLCGRDPEEEKMRVHRGFDSFRRRQRWLWSEGASPKPSAVNNGKRVPVVGIPRALTSFSHLPMWRRLLEELGAKVVQVDKTNRQMRETGAALTAADFCFPVKAAHGQVAQGVHDDALDFVFVPHLVAQPSLPPQSNTFLCPYVQAFPAVIRSAFVQAGYPISKLLTPTLDRRLGFSRQVKALHASLGPALGKSELAVRRAFRAAIAAQEAFEARCAKEGAKALGELQKEHSKGDGRPGIVIIGRPYNVNDTSLNLDLPRKIAEMGYRVLPVDLLPFDPSSLKPQHHSVFWSYGQRILSALELIRKRDDLFAVYFTNFSCGPDSFLLSYAEQIMGDKPMLNLELDEHGADAGYITRIEAFLDVTRSWKPTSTEPDPKATESSTDDLHERRIWMPPMHPIGSELFAAAFRGDGYDARALPNETHADLDLGQRLTRGCECLPMRTTIGCFINTLQREEDRSRKHALFMPTAKGPCRFGQYATLDRQILDRIGYRDVSILSPTSDNTYAGLSEQLRRVLWKALLTCDIIYKLGCRVRPYEWNRGETDAAIEVWTAKAVEALERRGDLREVVARAGRAFARIPVREERRPLVGVVGEIYVRNNVFANEDVIRAIERAGGEAWMSPITEWILFTAYEDVKKFVDLPKSFKQTFSHGKRLLKSRWLQADEAAFYRAVGPILNDRHEPAIGDTVIAGQRYLPFNIGGEAILSLGRAVHFARQGAALVVNASPFGCMAGTVCTALFSRVESELRMPVVNLFYDGAGDENRRLEVFLANLEAADARSGSPITCPTPRRDAEGLGLVG